MRFREGDRVTTDDDPTHGGTILSIDRYGLATVQFDQRYDAPFPADEIDVGDLIPFQSAHESAHDTTESQS
jgi:hypothetical protein